MREFWLGKAGYRALSQNRNIMRRVAPSGEAVSDRGPVCQETKGISEAHCSAWGPQEFHRREGKSRTTRFSYEYLRRGHGADEAFA